MKRANDDAATPPPRVEPHPGIRPAWVHPPETFNEKQLDHDLLDDAEDHIDDALWKLADLWDDIDHEVCGDHSLETTGEMDAATVTTRMLLARQVLNMARIFRLAKNDVHEVWWRAQRRHGEWQSHNPGVDAKKLADQGAEE